MMDAALEPTKVVTKHPRFTQGLFVTKLIAECHQLQTETQQISEKVLPHTRTYIHNHCVQTRMDNAPSEPVCVWVTMLNDRYVARLCCNMLGAESSLSNRQIFFLIV